VARILLIEDDAASRQMLATYLLRQGHDVIEAANGVEALSKAHKADLIILDLVLPEMTGWDVAEELRLRQSETPILIASALHAEEERLRGYELGADDYITKPVCLPELSAKIKVILRRCGITDVVSCGSLKLLARERQALVNSKPADLTSLEFDILWLLATNSGRVFTRQQIMDRVWGDYFTGNSRTVDVAILRLRRKLGKAQAAELLETVRGVGYRLRVPAVA